MFLPKNIDTFIPKYRTQVRLVEGPMRTEVETELLEHAKEELMHADRIVKLNMKKIWRILL
jgi:bacterioferritin (cytochrome b1)